MKSISLVAQHEWDTNSTKVLVDRPRYLPETKCVGLHHTI